jgi:hypothetical protein
MPIHDEPNSNSLVSHAAVLRSRRVQIEALRELARSDQESARLAEAKDLYASSIEQLLNVANEGFAVLTRLDAALRNSWYIENAPYDASEEASVIERYRSWLSDSDEATLGIGYFASEGRRIEGAEEFRENVQKAQAVLEDDAIRKQAKRIMPSREKLEALAKAHLRSTDG